MKRRLFCIAAVLAGFAVCAMAQPNGPAAPREVLVKFRALALGAIQQIVQDEDIDMAKGVGGNGVLRLRSRSKNTDVLVARLQARADVEYAEPNYIVYAIAIGPPNDPYYLNDNLWGMPKIGAPATWDHWKGSIANVVGVIDTGVDYTHPDLADNIWKVPSGKSIIGNFGPNGSTLTCGAGTSGYNAVKGTCDPMDDNNHGTHVSGTIGAKGNNGVGVVGVNWTASIMALKFLGANGSGYTSDAIDCIEFAIQANVQAGANVRVLSNSWGGGGSSQALLAEINRANTVGGMLFVAAAGNDGRNNDSTPFYPASYDAPNVVSVAATDSSDGLASFSNYGATGVDLAAPGVGIWSTVRGGYASYSGTSMATPHVAGAAALILSNLAYTTAQLKSQILNNVDPIPSLSGKTITGGRLNVCRAIPGCSSPPLPDFSISATPLSASVTQGGTATYTVNVVALNTFSSSVSLSVVSSPALNATVTLTPSSVTPGTLSSLTVVTTTATTAGTYTLTITGTSGTLTHSTQVTLVVNAVAAPSFTLTVTPSSITVPRTGGTADYTLTVTPSGGFIGVVGFSVTGQPAGPTVTFTPTTVTGSGSSTMKITVLAGTKAKTYPLVVTATSGSIIKTVSAALVVKR